jgi:type I restriction enzyme S subunit
MLSRDGEREVGLVALVFPDHPMSNLSQLTLFPRWSRSIWMTAWEQRKLGELGFAQSGIGFPDAEQGGTEGTPFFKVSDMNTPGNEYELVASNNYVTAEQIARMGWRPINQVPAIFFAKVGAAVMLNRKRLINEPFLLDNNTMAFSMDSSLLDTQFGQSLFERLDLTSLIQVGALPSFNSSDVESIFVSLPSTMNEQRQIGQYLCDLNTLITLHQREPRFADTG